MLVERSYSSLNQMVDCLVYVLLGLNPQLWVNRPHYRLAYLSPVRSIVRSYWFRLLSLLWLEAPFRVRAPVVGPVVIMVKLAFDQPRHVVSKREIEY